MELDTSVGPMVITVQSGNENEEDPQESLLLSRICAGDEHAFTKLVTRYLDPVTRFAFYILASHDAAEEIAQDVFVSLWERRETLCEIKSLKSYLFRAVRNRALNEQKSARVRDRYRVAMQTELEANLLSTSVNPEESMLTATAVQAAILQLPERRQLVLRLRIEEQLTHVEIGEILDISPDAARVLVNRAVADLREKLRVFG